MGAQCMGDLQPAELAAVGIDVAADGVHVGYGFVVGEMPEPTAAQHRALIDASRSLGRFLSTDETASVVGADGGDDAHD